MTITLSLPVIFGILWSALVVGLCVISLVAVELACGAIERVKRNRHSAATSDPSRCKRSGQTGCRAHRAHAIARRRASAPKPYAWCCRSPTDSE